MTTKAEKKEQVELIWRESFQSELDNALKEQLRQAALSGVKTCLESALRQELSAHLGFAPYQRQEKGAKPANAQRSGYFKRQTESGHGLIVDLKVPKLRCGNKDREWKILTRYQRCLKHALDMLLYIYTLGLSLRDLQEALYVLLGDVLSTSAINQVTTAIQDQALAAQQRPLGNTPPILLVDGVWVTILYPTGQAWQDRAGHKRQQRRKQERVILTALAVWPDGQYQVLHYEVADGENVATWKTFWQHLIERGLDPAAVQLVVSDGTKGLLAAMEEWLPKAKLQRCTVHKVRGMDRYLCYQALPDLDPNSGLAWTEEQAKSHRRAEISQEAHDIFKAPTLSEAQQRLAAFVTKWQPLEPQAVRNFTWGIRRCFTFYEFDKELYRLIHSTNLLERFFREFRAKTDEVGCFPNEASCLTLVHLVMVRDRAKHRLNFAKT